MHFVLLAAFIKGDITKTIAMNIKIPCGTGTLQCMQDIILKRYVYVNIISVGLELFAKCDPTGKHFVWMAFKGIVLKFRLDELHWGPGLCSNFIYIAVASSEKKAE